MDSQNSTESKVIQALQLLAPYFRPTWAPAFEVGGIYVTLNPGHTVELELQDIDRRMEEICKTAGMKPMGLPRFSASSQSVAQEPTYNSCYPEQSFIPLVNSVLGLSKQSRCVLLMPSSPRYIVINGDDNLRILASKGIQFCGHEKYLQSSRPQPQPASRP